MKMVEALGRTHQEEPQWTTEETVDKLILLQDQTVNLFPALQRNVPSHAHYRPNWHPDQPQEPESLRPDALSIFDWQTNKTLDLYKDYFEQHGIKKVTISISSPQRRELVIMPHGGNRNEIWPAGETIALFPQVDFIVEFYLSHAIRREVNMGNPGLPMFIPMNTTKINGDLYRIDIPAYRTQKRDEDTLRRFVQGEIKGQASRAYNAYRFVTQAYHLPDKEWGTDEFVIARQSQRLISDLLAARV